MYHRRIDMRSQEPVFPSWSWAGWEGEIEYERNINACESIVSKIRWQTNPGKLDKLQRELEGLQPPVSTVNADIDRWTRKVHKAPRLDSVSVHYIDRRGDPLVRFRAPVNREETSTVQAAMDPETGYLQFRVKSAVFTISSKHTKYMTLPSPCDEGRHQTCLVTALDDTATAAGAVYVNSELAESIVKIKQEFIALSQTTLSYDTDDPSWDPNTNQFLYPLADGQMPKIEKHGWRCESLSSIIESPNGQAGLIRENTTRIGSGHFIMFSLLSGGMVLLTGLGLARSVWMPLRESSLLLLDNWRIMRSALIENCSLFLGWQRCTRARICYW